MIDAEAMEAVFDSLNGKRQGKVTWARMSIRQAAKLAGVTPEEFLADLPPGCAIVDGLVEVEAGR